MRTQTRCILTLLAAAAASTHAAEIVPLERDSSVLITLSNLDVTPGGTTTGDPIELFATGLESGDDIVASGNLYYGPDGFDRINTGAFNLIQDLTVDPGSLATDLTQSASVTGEASPLVAVDSEMCYWFTVDADAEGALSFDFDGETNVGNDAVGASLQRVDSGNSVLETLFTLAGTGLDGNGSGTETISLTAGERYKLTTRGEARSLVDSGPATSHIRVTISVGTSACNDADLAEPFGLLDLADISAFVSGFTTQGNESDLNSDGVWDLDDIGLFVTAFSAGCP